VRLWLASQRGRSRFALPQELGSYRAHPGSSERQVSAHSRRVLSESPAKGGVEPGAQFGRDGDGLGAAQDFDAVLGLVEDQGAIPAFGQVNFELALHGHIEVAVDVIGDLEDDGLAIQFVAPLRK
jgi:hypothetical protein